MIKFDFPQLNGDCVYHYTSGSALSGILQTDKVVLRLTCADYLNDTTEGVEIFKHVKTACENLLNQGKLRKELYKMITEIVPADAQEYPTWYYQKADDRYCVDHKPCNVYTMSFSQDSDSLPMWNYYAGHGSQGYCLHFNIQKLKNIFPTQFECFCAVESIVYTPDIVKSIEDEILHIAKESDNEIAFQRVKDYLALVRYFYKAGAFEYEKECRLLLAVPKNSAHTFDTKFREKDGYIIPYVEIELSDWQQRLGLIKGITVGPFANKELASKGIIALLENRGYLIESKNVLHSTIPVRY